jgi:hypothetical protein
MCVCVCVCVCVCDILYNIYKYTNIHTGTCLSILTGFGVALLGRARACVIVLNHQHARPLSFAPFPRSISPATAPLPARQAGMQSMAGWLVPSLEGALEPPLEAPTPQQPTETGSGFLCLAAQTDAPSTLKLEGATHAPAARAHDAARAPRRVQHVRPPLLQRLQKQVCVCARARVSYTCLHSRRRRSF